MLFISYCNNTNYQVPLAYHFRAGESATGTEVISGTTNAQLTCTVSGITETPVIMWNDGRTANIESDDDFTVGAISLNGNMAESILTIKKASTVKATYTCIITSEEWSIDSKMLEAELHVFSKL